VSSNFTKFTEPKYKTNHKLNFEQHPGTKGEFYYSFKENKKLKLPIPKEIVAPNPYETKNILKPTQTSFNFEQKEEIEEIEAPLEETTIIDENCPLFEDIIAADKINDPIRILFERLQAFNIHNLQEINVISILDNKKVTINIANL
jgi:hypothetical protein